MWAKIKALYDKVNPNRTITLIIIGALTMMFLYFAKSCDSPNDVKYRAQIQAYQDSNIATLKYADSVKKVNDVLQATADSSAKAANAREQKIVEANKKLVIQKAATEKKLHDLQTANANCEGTCGQWRNVAEEEHAQLDSAASLHKQDSTAFQEQKTATANLQIIVDNDKGTIAALEKRVSVPVPTYHEPKLLGFIPLPSRKHSFIAGVALGVVSMIVIHK
jgi:beta-galactosidase/beta-glucuronidase